MEISPAKSDWYSIELNGCVIYSTNEKTRADMVK